MTAVGDDDLTAAGADVDEHTALVLDAREALACAPGGTLHVDGTRFLDTDGGSADVSFHDDDGTPTFFAAPESAVARAAAHKRAAVLTVPTGAHVADATALILAGRLAVARQQNIEGEIVFVITLRVHTVVVERDDTDGTGGSDISPTVSHRVVPLAAWTSARPDPMQRTAQRIVRHTNESHPEALRSYLAGLRSIPESDLLAVEIAHLDAAGVEFLWLDDRGSHRTRVRFARPAECPGGLAMQLRETLTG